MKIDVYNKKGKLINRFVKEKLICLGSTISFLLFFVALSHTSIAQISGVVYRDFNEDGVRSYTATYLGEVGVGGVTVNVYNSGGLVGNATTSSATATVGTYSITPSGNGPYRVEFINLPTGYYEGSRGSASGTSVQFVANSPATNVNLGINYPTDYCQADPNFFVPCYVNGNSQGATNVTNSAATQGVLVTLPYSSVGDSPSESAIATNAQIGTVYGVAYQRTAQTIFTSAFVKRHSGLGSGGAGAIYVTVPSTGTTFTSRLFTTLPSAVSAVSPAAIGGTTVVGSNTGTTGNGRNLPDATTTLNVDGNSTNQVSITFDQVGKAGLGDIELSEDGTQLYAVNLGDRRLYQIPITNPNTTNPTTNTANITSFALPTVANLVAGSVFRPFALKSYRGLIYVGGVTTNEAVSTTVNLGTGSTGGTTPLITRDPSGMQAIVYAFDPAASTFTQVLTFPLTYQKGATGNDQTGVSRADRWYPWVSTQPGVVAGTLPTRYARNDLPNASHPQPILAGIEFDVDGSMILSIRDRFGDQYGNNNYGTSTSDTRTLYRAIAPGDILRAGRCTAGVEQWTIESNASVCSGTATAGASTNQGPGGGEYYYADAVPVGYTQNNVFIPYHAEMSEGGLALLPGRNEVASTALDPTDNIDSGGIRRFKNSDGSGGPSTSVQIYRSGDVSTYGKANGLGDLELDCDLPPIQIGNRVFLDTNGNGIQDPGESGIAGIQVVLRGPNATVLATATTNATGEYYFSTGTGTTSSSAVTGLALTTGSSYTLSFPTSYSAYALTTQNAGTGANADAIDSDPSAAGFVAFVLGSAGQNNFTYDAGYSCVTPTVTLSSATVCAGQSATLVATSGFTSYSYSTGLTPVTNQPNAASLTTATSATASTVPYSVTVTNAAGCSAVATSSVVVNSLPVVTLSSITVCAGQTATLTATNGLATYAFPAALTRVGQTNTATITTSTTVAATTTTLYSVTVTNAAGCSAVASGSVTINPNPVVTLSSATVCAGQTATLTATPGFSSYAFSSGLVPAGQANTATLATSAAATASTTPYSVTVTNTNGCSAVATGFVTINALPVVTLSSATVCAGQSTTLTATSGFTTYAFSTGLTRIGQTNAASLATSTTATAGTTTYSVTVTNTAGCSAVATGSVTINPNPVATLANVTVCAGQTATLTATPGFSSYVFSAGLNQVAGQANTATLATSTTATTMTTTPYAVTVTSATGCSAVASGSVTVNPIPVATLSSATVCAGQTATLTATGGFSSYAFSTGLTQTGQANVATLPTSTTAAASTAPYSVIVTNANGCSAVATSSVTINAVPAVTLNSVTVCAGQTATLTATPGFSSYAFSGGLNQVVGQINTATIATSTTIATTTTTPYSVTVTNLNGCSAVAAGFVTSNPVPVATLSSVTVCAGQTATLTATPGLSSYAFSTGLNQVVGQTNTATLSTLATASTMPYSVTVTNPNGCSAVATGTVTINANPTVTLSSVTVCAGQTATLTATPGFSSYAFSTGLNQVVGQTNTATIASSTTAAASTTLYSVTVTNPNGCSAVASGSVTVNPVPVVTLSSATVCAGQTATLTATGGFSSYVFSAGLNQVVGQLNTATITPSVTAAASTTPYSVVVTNTNGCSAVASGSVTVNPVPVVTLGSVTVCAGQTATLTATPGFSSYAFSAGLNQVVGQTNTATLATSAAIPTATTTPYAVTVTNATGCSAIAMGSVTVNPNPAITLSSATVCAGQTATLTATPGFGSYAFSAGLNQGVGQTNTATLATATTVTTATTTPYSVTVTNTAGCSAVATSSVTINPVPAATLSSVTLCAGQTATLRATNGFSAYVFSAGLTQVGQGNTATITPSATAAASTTPYTVTVTNAAGCSVVATGSVTVNATPVVTLSSVTVCAGQTATLSATSGFSAYAFSTGLNQVVGQTNTATLATSAAVTTATTTAYSVTVTNATGCSAVATGSVTVNPNPVITLSSITVCAGQTATLTATPGFSSYAFSTGLTQTGQANVATLATSATASGATTPYSVTVTNATGCSAVATGSITVNPLPTASLSSVTLCTGQTAILTAAPGYATYQFSAGLTQVTDQPNTATTTTAGTYSVVITSAAGCSSTAVGSVTYNNTPVVMLGSVTVCAGQTPTLTATPGFNTYIFSTGLTPVAGQSNVATAVTAGTYSVTALSSASCAGSATATVTIVPNPVVTLSSATVCAGQTATLTATSGFSSYAFSTGLNQVAGQTNTATLTTTATAAASTTPYSVTVTSAFGCSTVTSGSITVNPNPVVTLSSATVCAGRTATLAATGGFSSYAFSAGLNQVAGQTNTATINTPATVAATTTTPYSVTVTNAAGCSAVATGSVTVNPNPAVTLSTVTVCAGQTATLRATNGFSSYAFSAGLTPSATQANVATITTLATTSAATTPYAVTVTNAAGCSAVATGSVTVNPTPVVTLSSATVCAGQTATLTATPGFAAYQFSTALTTATGQANVATIATLATASGATTPYSVTVTNATGCSAVASGSVTVNDNPVATLSSVTVCAGQTATLTATDGFGSYVFSAGLNQVVGQTNTATITTLATAAASTTPYSVTVTNASGCSAIATGSLTINALPTVTLSSATVCAGQSVTLTATAGLSTYAFSTGLTRIGQTNAATLTTLTTASATTTPYSVTVTNVAGCSAVTTGSVTVNANPVVTLSSVTVCAGQTATLTATDGFSSYAFPTGLNQVTGQANVVTLATSATVTTTTATPYSVTVATQTGCSAVATGFVTVNPNPVVTLSSVTVCAGQTATLAATTGFGSYVFSAGLSEVVGQTNTATITTPTTLASASTTPYSVTVTNATGCSAVATGFVTVNPNPVVTLSSVTVCAGQTASLGATGGFSSYAFSADLTPSATQANVATLATSATALAGTTPYSVTVTNPNGCSAVATGTVTINANPTVILSSVTVCAGQTVTLTATPGFGSYVFSTGLSPVAGQTNTATLATLATATASTTPYSVTITSGAGCSAVATGFVTINPNPVATLSSVTVCAGQTATLTATDGFSSYAFSADLTPVSGQANVATITTLATASAATTPYAVTVTNAAGCSAVTTGSVTVNPNPVVTLSSVTVCAGQTVTLTATPGFGSYVFSTGLNRVAGQTNAATITTPITALAVTTPYSVTVTNATGCSAVASGSVTVNPIPVVTLSSVTVCAGQTATLTATDGFSSYAFSAGLNQVVGQTNTATLATTVASTTPYAVTVTSGAGCSAVATGTVTVNANPVATLSSVTVCAGQTATLTATPGFATYQFPADFTPVSGQANVATITTSATSLATTTPYSVTVTNATGCSAVASGLVTVNPNPVATLSAVTVCAGQTASLTATPGFSSYVFSAGLNQVVGQINTATITTPAAVSTVTTTPYSVTVTNANGCSAAATGSITINPAPVVTLSSATICAGQTATLAATPGFSAYQFSAGLTQLGNTNIAIATTNGRYAVIATDVNGCSATASATVTVNPNPVLALTSATICAGQSATLTATPGLASYSFSGGLVVVTGQPNVATGIADGIYSVTATNDAGCSSTATGSITINPNPVVTLSSATICAGQTASLTATAGYTTYQFSAGLTPVAGQLNAATSSIPGVYSVTAISTEGCSNTATGSITLSPDVVVTLSSATICAGQTGVLTATAGYNTYLFSTGLTQVGSSNVASTTVAGTYSVTAINSTGCSGTATAALVVNPTAVVTLSSATICAGQSATLTATAGFANYVFSAGLTPVPGTPNVAVGAVAGAYSVTATSSASCSGSATGSITVNPAVVASLTASSATLCQGQSATLTASGGDTYLWSTNEQTPSIVVTTSGVYSVTALAASGCTDVASTTITVNPLPLLTINSATVCTGQSASLTVGGCDGGTIQWSNGANTATILVAPTAPTTYSVICTFPTGCASTTATTVDVFASPSYTTLPQAFTASCTGATANNDARILLTGLQNTERVDIVLGSTYGTGPGYGATTNLPVSRGIVGFTNLPNPAISQPYTIRLYNPGGTCYTDVTVILEPAFCNCPPAKCVPFVIKKTQTGRTAIR